MKNTTQTFNGSVSYPDTKNEVYTEKCTECSGNGHVHCTECGEEKRCPNCGGSGRKNIYQGNVFKIYWDVPVFK